MKRTLTLILGFLPLVLVSAALAGDPGTKMTQVASMHKKNTQRTPGHLEMPAVSPMLAEIQAVMDSARVREVDLRLRLGQDDPATLKRELADLKTEARLQVLNIQLRYAHQENRTELEQRIKTSIEDLLRPAPPGGSLRFRRSTKLPNRSAGPASTSPFPRST